MLPFEHTRAAAEDLQRLLRPSVDRDVGFPRGLGDAIDQCPAIFAGLISYYSYDGSLCPMNAPLRVVLLSLAATMIACSDTETKPSTPTAAAKTTSTAPPPPGNTTGGDERAALVVRGRATYNSNCIACHHPDPSLDGTIGPAVAGSPFELVAARVMRGAYPEGYTPKRDTRVMIALPHLENDLGALTAFLAQ